MFNSHQSQRLQELADTIFRMAYAAEIKEWDNRAHLKRIRGYSLTLCSGLGIPKNDGELLSLACLLHDIGKSATPDELLLRKGDYEDFEWSILEKHTHEGESILRGSSSPILQAGAIIAATHHERWDGSGYPNKLFGEDIPLSGRICAVADVFDALTTSRTYKDSMDTTQALDLILKSSGILFDPKIVKVFEERFSDISKIKNSSTENNL